MDFDALLDAARLVRESAYAPYSRFRVGAAILGQGGDIYVGCNVENATYGATICAERAAICQMVAAGERRLRAVAVYVDADSPATPCGICRQVLAEFGDEVVVLAANWRETRSYTLAQLLPERFSLDREGRP